MQDMMHCLNPSLLERQRAHLQWQQQHISIESLLGEGWPNLTTTHQYPIDTREEEVTTHSPTAAAITTTSSAQTGKEKSSSSSSMKRKAHKSPLEGSDDGEKRLKGDQRSEGENQQGDRRQVSGISSTENSEKKLDYIHVRARRGQATDSHSLAERVRRERIGERMKYLQGLVPGCNKIAGKAGMLDEIINYVQSLQRQVEFLSMKLAAMNPRLDFNMESLLTKQMNLPCNYNISTVGMSLPEVVDPTFLQFHSLQQAMASCGFRRTISAPVSTPATALEPFLDSFINVQRTNAGWDNDLHYLYGSAFPFHSFQGNILSNLKSEM